MSHLENLLIEYYEWRDYIVRHNIKVGPLKHGGWEGELDIVAYDYRTRELVHLEPSIDALSWSKREERFGKKFAAGRKYIFTEVFPWLGKDTTLQQIAIVISRGARNALRDGGQLKTLDEVANEIKKAIAKEGKMSSKSYIRAISHATHDTASDFRLLPGALGQGE